MRKGMILFTALLAVVAFGFTAGNAHAEGAVTGVVLDADGAPVAGAMVMLHGMQHERGERPYMEQTETNDDGQFGFRQVPAGNYVVSAMQRDVGGAREEIEVVDDEVTEVELVLQGRQGGGDEPGFGVVGGRVVDAEGDPVPRAQVTLMMMHRRGDRARGRFIRVETRRDGTFLFPRVPEGNYMIMAAARGLGFARDRVEVVADEGVRVQLQLNGWHRGDDEGDGGRDWHRHHRGGDERF